MFPTIYTPPATGPVVSANEALARDLKGEQLKRAQAEAVSAEHAEDTDRLSAAMPATDWADFMARYGNK